MEISRYHERLAAAMFSTSGNNFMNHASLKKFRRARGPNVRVGCLKYPLEEIPLNAL